MYKPDATINRECINKVNVSARDCWEVNTKTIKGGIANPTAQNELAVVCKPNLIEIYANGVRLWKTNSPRYSCAGGLGIEARTEFGLFNRKAIYDRFEVSCPSPDASIASSNQNFIAKSYTSVQMIEPPGE